MNIYPAWNNHRVTLSSDPSVVSIYFRVLIDNNCTPCVPFSGNEQTIFEGMAVRTAGGALEVSVNDIVADYFDTHIDGYVIDSLSVDHLDRERLNIAVRVDTSADQLVWTNGTPFALLADWSFRPWTIAEPGWLNDPIRLQTEPGFYFTGTIIGAAANEQLEDITVSGGTSTAELIGAPITTANADVFTKLTTQDPGDTVYLKTASDLLGPEFLVAEACHRYALYYRNGFGGLDFLVVQGPVTRAEVYTRNTAGRHADQAYKAPAYTRSIVSYRNDVTERWTLPLGVFTDDEASRLWHLAGSTDVWLYDRVDDIWTPLRITDGENIDKTYRNQGHKRVEYTLTAETAQERLRR